MQGIDLQKLMGKLSNSHEQRALKIALKRVMLLQSCGADVTQAINCMRVLADCGTSTDEGGVQPTVRQSLLTNAIISYSRGTSGTGTRGGRGASQIDNALKGQLLADHRHIIEVRNTAIAHVHVGHSRTDWHQQHYLLVMRPEGLDPVCVSVEQTYNKNLQEMLHRLLPVAQEIIFKRFDEANSHATRCYNAAFETLPIKSAIVDLYSYFDDPNFAKQILEKQAPGIRTLHRGFSVG